MSVKTEIDLYNYQKGAIDKIFERFEDCPSDYHLLYQLPTGGGKTIIFSEIVRQYLKLKKEKSSCIDSQDRVMQSNIQSFK